MIEKKKYIQPSMEEYPLHLATAVCSGGGLTDLPGAGGGNEPTPLNGAPKRVMF